MYSQENIGGTLYKAWKNTRTMFKHNLKMVLEFSWSTIP